MAPSRGRDAGAREIWLVDEDFADWPLGEREVVEHALPMGALASPALTLIAHSFDEVARGARRFAEWRRQWAHVVECRTDPELEAAAASDPALVPG